MTDKNFSTEYTGVYTGIFPNMSPREIELEARVKELEEQLTHKTQECEELRERIKAYENLILHIKCPHCNKELDLILDGTEERINLLDRYRKALEEIKSIRNKTCEVCQIFRKCDKEYSTCENARIIDIINKAKGSDNE